MHSGFPFARLLITSAMTLFAVTQVEAQPGAMASRSAAATPSAMMVPLTSASSTAKNHFMLGLRDVDIGRGGVEARAHFLEAVGADPSFALAHLYAAQNGNTPAEYLTHLNHATGLAAKASTPERLMIDIEQRQSVSDPTGALKLARQLVAAVPSNPRALQTQAGIEFQLGKTAEGRATLERAVRLAPGFAPAHIQLGDSYLQLEPKDVAKGEAHIRHALKLEPNAGYTHDYMGDAYRAKNDLANARGEYTRQAELEPTRAIAFQQRGHVNSFLGNFAEARADYDKSISLGDPAEKASYPVFRALVNVYEGKPAAAEQELEDLVAAIDRMDTPDKVGAKIGALSTEMSIAVQNHHLDVATRAADRLRTLFKEQELGANPAFQRSREANIIYTEGRLAAAKGDYAGTRAKAQEYMKVVGPDMNPRKNERAHELLGLADLLERNYAVAAGHFSQANKNSIYVTYNRALALEGSGKKAEARTLFKRVADTNFNGVDVALTKSDAARRAK